MRALILCLFLTSPALADPALNGDTPPEQQAGGHMAYTGTEAGFQDWLTAFRPRALAAGLAPSTLDALEGLGFDPAVVDKDRNQSEFTKPIWTYLDSAASDDRIAAGEKALARHRALYDRLAGQGGQAWLTGTEAALFDDMPGPVMRFRISGGRIAAD